MVKNKVYQARGEKELNNTFKRAIGKGVNEAIKCMMDDVRNMDYNDVYDTFILISNINIMELNEELERIQHRKEEIKKELNLLNSNEKKILQAISDTKSKLNEYQDNKKKDRNVRLNNICNKILIEYSKNKESFDSVNILSIVDDSNIEESINIVVGYLQNSLNNINIEDTIVLHENEFDKGYKIKLDEDDINKIIHILDELRY